MVNYDNDLLNCSLDPTALGRADLHLSWFCPIVVLSLCTRWHRDGTSSSVCWSSYTKTSQEEGRLHYGEKKKYLLHEGKHNFKSCRMPGVQLRQSSVPALAPSTAPPVLVPMPHFLTFTRVLLGRERQVLPTCRSDVCLHSAGLQPWGEDEGLLALALMGSPWRSHSGWGGLPF